MLVVGTASADQTICNNTAPVAITATAPTGGTGTYTYQWEMSTDGGTTWSDVAGATALSYTPGALTQTTRYRLKQTSGTCGTVTTNAVIITVNPLLVVSAPNSLCVGNTANASPSSGGTWTSSNVAIATIDINTGLITGISQGSVNFTFTQTSTNCSATTSPNTIINPKPNTTPITHN